MTDRRRYSRGLREPGPETRSDPAKQAIWGLIGLNVAVFAAWTQVRGEGLWWMRDHFMLSLESLLALRVWTLITSAFSHMDANHLLLNMLALWVFGSPVAQQLGRGALLRLYLVGALVASVTQLGFFLATGSAAYALGASGSTMALAVVYAAMFPERRLLLFFVLPVRAPILVAGFIALDLFGVIGNLDNGIANAAHLGGALYGGLYYWRTVRDRPLSGLVSLFSRR